MGTISSKMNIDKSGTMSVKSKLWKESDMVTAMKAVTEGMKCGTAAEQHNVPRKSLENRIKRNHHLDTCRRRFSYSVS